MEPLQNLVYRTVCDGHASILRPATGGAGTGMAVVSLKTGYFLRAGWRELGRRRESSPAGEGCIGVLGGPPNGPRGKLSRNVSMSSRICWCFTNRIVVTTTIRAATMAPSSLSIAIQPITQADPLLGGAGALTPIIYRGRKRYATHRISAIARGCLG